MNCGHHCFFLFFFARVSGFSCVYMCTALYVCVNVTQVCFRCSLITLLWPENALCTSDRAQTHIHMPSHMDTAAHTPLNVEGGDTWWSQIWGSKLKKLKKERENVVRDQSKEILLNDFSSMYKQKPNYHICTSTMSAWHETLKRKWQLASQTSWLL